jgi:type I restriction enzyme S subunit
VRKLVNWLPVTYTLHFTLPALELKAFYQSGHIRNYYNQTTGIQNITLPQYLSMPIVVPSKAEQERIVQYLDGACSKIDSLINSSHKKMAELTEMKQVMISDVVTGKIDVRNIIIPEYEHIDDIFDEYSEANNDEKEEKSTMEEE